MKISKNFLIRPLSMLIAFTFSFTSIAWPETPNYTPFDEDQAQSQFLTQDQLDKFTNIKQSLIETRNETSPQISTEPEIIEHLYDIIIPEDLTSLTSLETLYNQSVASREQAQNAYDNLLSILASYYQEVENARNVIENVYNQIDSVSSRINSLESEASQTTTFRSSLENDIATKTTEGQTYLNESAQLENDLNLMYVSLNNLSTNKGALKSNLNAAEAVLNEKTNEKQTLENEIASLLTEVNSTSSDLLVAETTLSQEEAELDNAIDLVHLTIAIDFDIYTSTYEKLFDGAGDLVGVTLPPEHDTGGVPTIEEKETILFNALIEDEEVQEATLLVTQKQALKDAAQTSYDTKLTEYSAFLPEYDQAVADYQVALASYTDIESVVSAFEGEIQAKEINLLASYEKTKLIETDINTLSDGVLATTDQINSLSDLITEFNTSLDILNARRVELENLNSLAQQRATGFEEGPELAAALMGLNLSIDQERAIRSLYEEALEERSEIISSLQIIDDKTKSELISAILNDLRDPLARSDQPLDPASINEGYINNMLLGVYDNVVLLDGKLSLEALLQDKQIIRKSLRKNYIQVFQREPTSAMLDVFVDATQRVKIPALRLFEILKRIELEKLKINNEEEEKLDLEKDLLIDAPIDEAAVEENQTIIESIADRLAQNSFSSSFINNAINFLTSIPSSLISCGIISLGNLFNSMGQSADKTTIAQEAILTDIVENNLSQNTEAGLQLSLFALQNAAKASGTELYGQHLTETDLGNITSPFVAHVSNDHYVMVKSIMDDEVTFFDPSPNLEITTSLNEFMQDFTGNALTLDVANEKNLLSENEMKNIYGAGWFSKAVSKAKSVAKSVSKTVSKAVSKTVSAAKSVAKSVTKTVSKAVSKTVSAAKSVASKAVSVAKSVATKAVSVAKTVATKTVSVAKSIASKAVSVATTVYSGASAAYQETKDTISDAWDSAKETGSELLEAGKEKFDNALESGKEYLANGWNSVKETGSTLMAAGKEKFGNAVESEKEYLANGWSDLKETAAQVKETWIAYQELKAEEAEKAEEAAKAEEEKNKNDGTTDLPVCSKDDKEYVATLETDLDNNNLTGTRLQTVIVIDESGISTVYTVEAPSQNNTLNPEIEENYNTQTNSSKNEQTIVTVVDRRDGSISYVPFKTQEDKTSSTVIFTEGTLKGLYMSNLPPDYLWEQDFFDDIPGSVKEVNFPDGKIPTKGLQIDIGGGEVTRNTGALNIDVRATGKLDGAFIKTKGVFDQIDYPHLEIPEVLEYLDSRGVRAEKIYFQNVPWEDLQTQRIIEASGNLLEPGGVMELAPRPPTHLYGSTEATTEIAQQFADATPNGILSGPVVESYDVPLGTSSYDDVLTYTVTRPKGNIITNSLDEFGRLTTVTKGLVILDIVISTVDIFSGAHKDVTGGFECHTTAAIGRTAGGFVGGKYGAIGGAVAGAAIGTFFGGPPGTVIGAKIGTVVGGILGGITGGLIGTVVGKDPCSSVGEIPRVNQGTMIINDPINSYLLYGPIQNETAATGNINITLDSSVVGERQAIPGETISNMGSFVDFSGYFNTETYSTWSSADTPTTSKVSAADVLAAVDTANYTYQ